tara:strand:+ start:1685 stop:2356 length:672 start_codon:yes stop_codon:yes gene_type:complete
MIVLNDVSIEQGNKLILSNVSLRVQKGEFIYLVGETGSGKSSFLKSLYAEVKIKTGEIFIDKLKVSAIQEKKIPELRRNLGIVFQDFQLLNDRNIFQNLEFVLNSTGWKNKDKINNRIKESLEAVHLKDVENKMPYELSGGEQQRAVIARSILNKPKLIIADEPTGNLDPDKSEKIINLLKEINKLGTTILIATHDYEIIKKFPSRIIKCQDLSLQDINIENL